MQIFVTSSLNDGFGSLRQAIDEANQKPESVVVVDPQIRKIQLEEEIIISENLTLIGNKVLITSKERIFKVSANKFTLQRTALIGARSLENGAAIYSSNENSEIVLDRVLIKRNRSRGSGGGVYTAGRLIVFSSLITENWTHLQGGGLWVGKQLILSQTRVKRNLVSGTAGEGAGGAGVFVDDGNVQLDDSSITQNRAPAGSGGGIVLMTGSLYLNDSQVDQNSAYNSGGIQEGQGNIYFYRSSASHNQSTNDQTGSAGGGGITITQGDVHLDQSEISGNKTVGMYSGGIVSLIGDVTINESRITGNENRGPGGGLALNFGSLYLNRSLVQDNTGASLGGGIVNFAPNPHLILVRESRISENTLTNDQTISQTIRSFLEVIKDQLDTTKKQAEISGPGGTKFIQKLPEILEKLEEIAKKLEELKLTHQKIGGGGVAALLSTRVVILKSLLQGNLSGKVTDKKNLPLIAVGGGVYGHNASIILNESEVKENQAGSTGGGIQNENELVLRFSRVRQNKAQNGGGIYATHPFVDINSEIKKNEPNNVVIEAKFDPPV